MEADDRVVEKLVVWLRDEPAFFNVSADWNG
jgi:hypothetical protein